MNPLSPDCISLSAQATQAIAYIMVIFKIEIFLNFFFRLDDTCGILTIFENIKNTMRSIPLFLLLYRMIFFVAFFLLLLMHFE